ncbi:hypothetical protein OG765_31755 [Streptomyces sp. NBC_00555]|uniref:COG4315 family predicted lipoprotein n=1 Tax=Streptomyces sp. NBC_00555 TaxID=2903662 RepID=UPI00225A48F3|nr:hypothetical protein [Streptomyces sp. NBC_00555]MCX5015498.1 hypothetical protein [Streptomyces sp. NBC_00555]
MRPLKTGTAALAPVLVLAALALTACGGAEPAASKPAPSTGAASVRVSDSPLGPILVDGAGRTLYGFTKDQAGASNCDAECVAVWPALTAPEVSAGPGTEAKLLAKTSLTEGATQARYGDWPLYYYVGDAVAGDVTGQGLDGEWFAIGADGKLVKRTV